MPTHPAIELRLPATDLRRWHLHVATELAARSGRRPRLTLVPARPAPTGLDLLFAFDRIFVGRDTETAVDRLDAAAFAGPEETDGAVDLVVDLAGGTTPTTARLLRPAVQGLPPLEGALAAILDEEVPILTVDTIADGVTHPVARWPVAIEDRQNTLRAASMVMGRLAHLVLCAVEATLTATDPTAARLHIAAPLRAERRRAAPGLTAAPRLFARTFADRVATRLTRLASSRADWRIVWRFRDPATPDHAPDRDPTPFRLVPDDGQRFYADPFPWTEGDRTFLFAEEYPYATGRGILSVCEIDAGGAMTPFRPILEQDCHLSYPNIFAHGGRMWMVPETGSRHTVELWVADAFPDRWSLHSVLLEGLDVYDATLAEIDGRWWMFASSQERWCSTWDALAIWTAPAPTGPWQPLGTAPAVVDVHAARPAGRLFRLADGWRRPVQDSSARYGGGLAVAKILSTDPAAYRETVEHRFATPAPLTGLHTWNQAPLPGRTFETMDIFASTEAFGPERVLDLTPR